jgi:hypothetical protein
LPNGPKALPTSNRPRFACGKISPPLPGGELSFDRYFCYMFDLLLAAAVQVSSLRRLKHIREQGIELQEAT